MSSGDSVDIRGFWQWFADHHLEILEIMGGRRDGKVTDLIDEALARHGLSITYEVTEGLYGGEITFTPCGDPVAAAFIDRFVAEAPTFDTWVIYSRRQRKSLQSALAFVKAVHGIDIQDAHFQVRFREGVYHLRFMHDGLLALGEDVRYAVVATFLDHALGEAVAMNFIGGIDFQPGGEGIEMALMINQLISETGEMAPAGTNDLPRTAT